MIWCYSVLLVQGAPASIDAFVKRARVIVREKGQPPQDLALSFAAFVSRPPELDLHESALGCEGYEAFYGNYASLLEQPRVRAVGANTRETLCAYLDWINPEYRRLADRYAQNQAQHGHRTWLGWNREHYGTKWDLTAATEMRRLSSDAVSYRFGTIEERPLPWVATVSAMYPELKVSLQASFLRPRVLLRAV
jgi:hypothetical protein